MPLPSTQSWLRENARLYSNSHAVYADADALLARFPPIRPKTDVYSQLISPSPTPQLILFSTAYDDGRSQLLLCFHGTLPITYRQATYNIPVAIWLTRDYPKEHPIPYVVATPDMLIRSSPYIDLSGRCNIEYIQNWQRKSEVRDYIPSSDLPIQPSFLSIQGLQSHRSRGSHAGTLLQRAPGVRKTKGSSESKTFLISQPLFRKTPTPTPRYTAPAASAA